MDGRQPRRAQYGLPKKNQIRSRWFRKKRGTGEADRSGWQRIGIKFGSAKATTKLNSPARVPSIFCRPTRDSELGTAGTLPDSELSAARQQPPFAQPHPPQAAMPSSASTTAGGAMVAQASNRLIRMALRRFIRIGNVVKLVDHSINASAQNMLVIMQPVLLSVRACFPRAVP